MTERMERWSRSGFLLGVGMLLGVGSVRVELTRQLGREREQLIAYHEARIADATQEAVQQLQVATVAILHDREQWGMITFEPLRCSPEPRP